MQAQKSALIGGEGERDEILLLWAGQSACVAAAAMNGSSDAPRTGALYALRSLRSTLTGSNDAS